jgi:hypothetical protein
VQAKTRELFEAELTKLNYICSAVLVSTCSPSPVAVHGVNTPLTVTHQNDVMPVSVCKSWSG